MNDIPYLLDQLEAADMLEIDGLHAFDFTLNDALLDQADAAAEAGEPFGSEEVTLTIDALDGREHKHWKFSYNSLMEAEYQAAENTWLVEGHRLKCLGAVAGGSDE